MLLAAISKWWAAVSFQWSGANLILLPFSLMLTPTSMADAYLQKVLIPPQQRIRLKDSLGLAIIYNGTTRTLNPNLVRSTSSNLQLFQVETSIDLIKRTDFGHYRCSENQTPYWCTDGYIAHPSFLRFSPMVSRKVSPFSLVYLHSYVRLDYFLP